MQLGVVEYYGYVVMTMYVGSVLNIELAGYTLMKWYCSLLGPHILEINDLTYIISFVHKVSYIYLY